MGTSYSAALIVGIDINELKVIQTEKDTLKTYNSKGELVEIKERVKEKWFLFNVDLANGLSNYLYNDDELRYLEDCVFYDGMGERYFGIPIAKVDSFQPQVIINEERRLMSQYFTEMTDICEKVFNIPPTQSLPHIELRLVYLWS